MRSHAGVPWLVAALLSALAAPGLAHGATVSATGGAVAFVGDEASPNTVFFSDNAGGVTVEFEGILVAEFGCEQALPTTPGLQKAFCPGQMQRVFVAGGELRDKVSGSGLQSAGLITNTKGGDDVIFGGNGSDILIGGPGGDFKIGGLGGDDLREPNTAETPDGPEDTVSYEDKGEQVVVNTGGDSNAATDGTAGEGDKVDGTIEKVVGTRFNDLMGSAGSSAGPVRLVGGLGDDDLSNLGPNTTGLNAPAVVIVSYEDHTQAVVAEINGTSGNGQLGESDTIGNTVTGLVGGSGSDGLAGNELGNSLTGGPGDDSLVGQAGDDAFFQTAEAGGGDDTIEGGEGTDAVNFSGRENPVRIDLSSDERTDGEVGERASIRSDVELASGGKNGDTIIGNAAANVLVGGPGDDTIDGGSGDDVVFGTKGGDSLSGGDGTDVILGDSDGQGNPSAHSEGAGDDTIDGGLGEDRLFGEDGGDKISSRDGMPDQIQCDVENTENPFTDDFLDGDLKDKFEQTGCNTLKIGAFDQGYGLQVSTRKVKIKANGKAKIKVSCPQSPVAKCVGDLELYRLAIKPDSPVRRAKIAFKFYRLKQGQKKTLTVKVKRKQAKIIRRAKGAKGEVKATEPDVKGQPKTTIQPVEIKAAKAKKKKKRRKARR